MTQDLLYSDHRLAIHDPEARRKPWPRQPHCRRRLHKAFLHWYAANEERFAIKLELFKRTDTWLHMGFCGISQILTAELTTYEINIVVEWQGTQWDLLQSFDAIQKRVPGGYVCELCPEDKRPIFLSREAIWRTEIFEPFLKWVSNDLVSAGAVSISGTPGWVGWARLVSSADSGVTR